MIENIKDYVRKKHISFHTPAHKGRNRYINKILKAGYDLTELEETDNLFYEEGCIKETEEELARKYNGKYFFLLVNGATSGVMASVNLFKENDKILVDRNCHISVINALILSGAKPIFIETRLNEFNIPYPPSLEEIKKAYEENKDAKALFITSPNYYGMKADLKVISDFCRENNLISIADEAHGTHYYYSKRQKTASEYGFSICILSFHKNLPSLTQTGGIIVNDNLLAKKIKENLRAFTSTSPSYLFMLSVDAMHKYMLLRGSKKLDKMYGSLLKLKEELSKKNIKILKDIDPFKFIINTRNAEEKAKQIKEKYKIVCEMCDNSNITYIISIHNYKREIRLLKKAILEFLCEHNENRETFALPKAQLTPKEATLMPMEKLNLKQAEGRICGEYIIKFPPSVPVIIPGEVIDKEIISKLTDKEKIICVKNNL